jgi:hypothetical protein
MTVLNPLKKVDEHIMDDGDMAGPIVILLSFATVLLLVRTLLYRMTALAHYQPI